jgi:bifunctional enzyme CysN/CysC/sulfate adenylyltransferase subunit 1
VSVAASSPQRDDLSQLLDHHLHKDLLRFTTAGSVDDGKSTLIGRLLHDTKTVYEDQLAAVRKSRINRSGGEIDLSLLTDGLRAEREQGITIDVAYRYFETDKRKFIIADTPGHEQYTRNMATGASTADLAVILVDATRGLLQQTRRHAYIASLLGIPSIVAAINKMDLLGYPVDVFQRLQGEFAALALQLGFKDVVSIPVSALDGDNVVRRAEHMVWYEGPSLLEHLESVPIRRAAVDAPVRIPVQYVIRPDANFRGFGGQIASGTIKPGDELIALPSKQRSRVRSIVARDGDQTQAFAPMSVTITLEDEIDVSRGDMLVSPEKLPEISRHFEAMVVWFDPQPMALGKTYLIKHAVRGARVKPMFIEYRVEMQELGHEPTDELKMNDIAAVRFEASAPLFFDLYAENRTTGSFILIDPLTNATAGAAMIRRVVPAAATVTIPLRSGEVDVRTGPVSLAERYHQHGHLPAVLLAGARPGLAERLERALFNDGFEVVRLPETPLSAEASAAILRLAEAAGLLLIHTGTASGWEFPAGVRRFDLAEMDLPAEEEAAVAVVLSALRPLRVASGFPEAE